MQLAGFTITGQLNEGNDGAGAVLSRGLGADGQAVLLKYPKEKHEEHTQSKHKSRQSDPAERLSYEYHQFKHLRSPFLAVALEFCDDPKQPLLVFEDNGGEPLSALWMHPGLTFAKRLKLACLLTQALTDIHQAGLTHRNLHPDNILLNPDTMNLQLVDLSCATELNRLRSKLTLGDHHSQLAYQAPEMLIASDAVIDHHSDFYSLGVILYQLFSGRMPFGGDDFATQLHAHVNRLPESLDALDGKIPRELSAIVNQLLAKSPDDRYHNHQGLLADLKDCQQQWETKGQVDHFTIAQHDIPTRFKLSSRLYGRSIEQTGLQAAFERASGGVAELILLSAKAGVGKSALVEQLLPAIVAKRGFFIRGNCDQFRRKPYGPFIEAFSDLINQLLGQSDERLRYWRGKLKTALDKNTAVIAEVIPQLVRLTPEIPDLAELPPTETQKRFHITFGHFIKALSSSGHPLVVFIDNLQWADLATLHLLAHQSTASDNNAVLFIGAYRPEQVENGHPIHHLIETVELAKGRLKSINLGNLARHHVRQMVMDSFGGEDEHINQLTDDCFDRCNGNPLFIKQYITALHEYEQLRFDQRKVQWQWQVMDIPAQLDTTDLQTLVMARIYQLPRDTQNLLTMAAHLGCQFKLEQLAVISETSSAKVAELMENAVRAGLLQIFCQHSHYRQSETLMAQIEYGFVHDSFQQAAHALIDDQETFNPLPEHRQITGQTNPGTCPG